MLEMGLIEPKCVAHILQRIVRDKRDLSSEKAESALEQLRIKLLDDVKGFRGDPVDLGRVVRQYEIHN
jgi:hypothetical protein